MPLTGKIPKLDTQKLFDEMVVLESEVAGIIDGSLGQLKDPNKTEEYWEISFSATTNNDEIIIFNLATKKTDPLLSKEKVETIKQQIESCNLSINEISKKPVKVKPKAPFITSTLQQSARTR